MSVLSYASTNEEEIFRNCTKECGIITSTEDQQYFALACILCREKFLYFDAFITHIQTEHLNKITGLKSECNENVEDLTDTELLVPQLEIKQEPEHSEENEILGMPRDDLLHAQEYLNDNEAADDMELSMHSDEPSLMDDTFGNYDDAQLSYENNEDEDISQGNESYGNIDDIDDEEDCNINYDDLVEESLISDNTSNGLVMHIKDRQMIKFLIDQYRRNEFLWNQRHPQFRDRVRRSQFLNKMIVEFKRRFNVTLARDAVTRKWDNLRTVYKRECNRMSVENSNVSSLWYFNKMQFLGSLNKPNMQTSKAVIKDLVYRRRISTLWNDASTNKLLQLVQRFPCFYDKYDPFYRSKEKRGEALQQISAELSSLLDVTSIQISKRLSQLRFDYSKQKQERLQCEANNLPFMPNYSYYEQMFFMDVDIAPFKCDYCTEIIQSAREMEVHMLEHTQDTKLFCKLCHLNLPDSEQLARHMATQHAIYENVPKETKYDCDLCTAKFREKANYEEHMRRHNDELFLPALASLSQPTDKSDALLCDFCDLPFPTYEQLSAHRRTHEHADHERRFRCEYPNCGKLFMSRRRMIDHYQALHGEEEYPCDICGKTFRSTKNLQNHKQIHDSVKRYVCKICGSAFSQAAGLYLHKRRHNRPDSRISQY